MRFRVIACLVIVLCIVPLPFIWATDVPEGGLPSGVADAVPALVRIYVVMEIPFGGRIERVRSAGSGAIISKSGHVVTNHHVAGNASHIVCTLADHQEIPARLVGTDALADIAVLELDMDRVGDTPLSVATWGDSDGIRVGDTVFAMGSPAAITQSVTRGVIANTQMIMPEMIPQTMELDGEDVGSVVRWIAHDATIFGGNSGGPLVNARGEIIGINEIGFAALGGAIPGNLAQSVANEIITYGAVQRSWSGVRLQARIEESSGGALIGDVEPGSPAERAGLAVGDLLLNVGDVQTDCRIPEDVPIVTSALYRLPVNSPLVVRYRRAAETLATQLTLAPWEPAQNRVHDFPMLGATARDTSRAMRRRVGLHEKKGVFVQGVRPGGPAQSARPPLGSGDVLVAIGDTPITGVTHLRALLERIPARTLAITVLRDGEEIVCIVNLGAAATQSPPARPERAWLPIKTQVITAKMAQVLHAGATGGMRITQVMDPACPLRVGDIITAVADQPVGVRRAGDSAALQRLLQRHSVGEQVSLAVLRKGAPVAIPVTLTATPRALDLLPTVQDSFLEFECRDLGEFESNSPSGERLTGVVVADVARGGWADLGGLRKGDRILNVLGQPVGDVTTLEKLLEGINETKPASVVVLVARSGKTQFLELEPVWTRRS